jgi:plasmid stability protein
VPDTPLAYAVVRGDPPAVYAADDIDTLHHVLALKVVAATHGGAVPPDRRERIRQALIEERWGDAVVRWIEVTGIAVDVYTSGLEVWSADRFSRPDEAGLELRLRPLFADD